MARATNVTPEPGFTLNIQYDDGTVFRLSLANELDGEVFEELQDPAEFAKVKVDQLGAIEWENGASLAPEFVSELPRLTPQRQ